MIMLVGGMGIQRRFMAVLVGFVLFLGPGGARAAPGPRQGVAELEGVPRSGAPVLLVQGADYPDANAFFHGVMDSYFGPDGWDLYDIGTQGLPDPPELFLNYLAQYQGVVWHESGAGGGYLGMIAPILADYVGPYPSGAQGGRLLVVSPEIGAGIGGLDPELRELLGVGHMPSPMTLLEFSPGNEALCLAEDLPSLTSAGGYRRGTGLVPTGDGDPLYRMEYCLRCYSLRPPYDPYVAVRTPSPQVSVLAKTVLFTIPLPEFSGAESMLHTLMRFHLGFVSAADAGSGAGKARLKVSNDGSLGSFFTSADDPSLVYPFPGYVEHLFQGGIWVGARAADGTLHVSSSSDHFGTMSEGYERREFRPADGEELVIKSSDPGSEFFDPAALAPWQLECSFQDDVALEDPDHQPLGLKVNLRAMAWDDYPLDDGVVLEYRVINQSGAVLRDLHFGLLTDTTVGNVSHTSPYPEYPFGVSSWNFYDDVIGGWAPGDFADDPDIWMMWKHDDDGDQGWATSWVGSRLLQVEPEPQPDPGHPAVSYNANLFRNIPEKDDTYWDEHEGTDVPGRYQLMSNGDFDIGSDGEVDYTMASDWLTLLSTGPFPVLAAGDTLKVSFAIVCGEDGWNLRRNSRRFHELAAAGWQLDVSAVELPEPGDDSLGRAVPNPFNPATEISFTLASGGWTRLEVYGLDGRLVDVLVDEVRPAGGNRARWDGRDRTGSAMASGLYLYRLTTPLGRRLTGQMTLVR
jgi:hypothetical protein